MTAKNNEPDFRLYKKVRRLKLALCVTSRSSPMSKI